MDANPIRSIQPLFKLLSLAEERKYLYVTVRAPLKDEDCPVCLRKYNMRLDAEDLEPVCIPITLYPCGHVLGKHCLDTYRAKSDDGRCRFCRRVIDFLIKGPWYNRTLRRLYTSKWYKAFETTLTQLRQALAEFAQKHERFPLQFIKHDVHLRLLLQDVQGYFALHDRAIYLMALWQVFWSAVLGLVLTLIMTICSTMLALPLIKLLGWFLMTRHVSFRDGIHLMRWFLILTSLWSVANVVLFTLVSVLGIWKVNSHHRTRFLASNQSNIAKADAKGIEYSILPISFGEMYMLIFAVMEEDADHTDWYPPVEKIIVGAQD